MTAAQELLTKCIASPFQPVSIPPWGRGRVQGADSANRRREGPLPTLRLDHNQPLGCR